MRKLLLYILYFFPLLAVAAPQYVEKVQLDWQSVQTDSLLGENCHYPYFQQAYVKDGLPYFHTRIEVDAQFPYQLKWENCQWNTCTPQEQQLLSTHSLADTLSYELYTRSHQNQKELHLECLPFVLRNGTYQKLVSANIKLKRLPQTKFSPAKNYSFQDASVLKEGNWVKVSVTETGIHKISYEELVNMGFSNPQDIRVFGYGGNPLEENFSTGKAQIADDLPEIPIYLETGADHTFNAGDYLLFYAVGPTKYSYDDEKKACSHTINPYSQKGYYFLTTDIGIGKKIEQAPVEEGPTSFDIKTTLTYQFHESEEVNLLESGREWYGDYLKENGGTKNVLFSIPYIVYSPLHWDVELVSTCRMHSSFSIQLNNSQHSISITGSSNSHVAGKKGYLKTTTEPNMGGTQNVRITYTANTNKSPGYINFIGLTAERQLYLDQSSLTIFTPGIYDSKTSVQYLVENANEHTQVWEITEPLKIQRIPSQLNGTQLKFNASYNQHRAYVAFNPKGQFPGVQVEGTVNNQNLHALPATQMIIITDPNLRAQAERIAEHHRNFDQLNVLVIDADKIYNEFSSGNPDPTAYRWFLKMFYDRAQKVEDFPQYLLFFGISSYDNRGIKFQKPPLMSYQSQESLISTQSYITDDYFGLLDDNEGQAIAREEMDLAIGRFPAANAAEADACVNKTIQYATNCPLGNWRNDFTFLADDGDNNLHMQQADDLTQYLLATNPAFKANKIYLDAYPLEKNASGAYYPKAKEEVLRHIKEGTLVFTYVGHGSPNTLTTELTITKGDIQYMNNSNLALWLTATCDFARYDNWEHSGGIDVLLNSHGGGVALFTTTRAVFSSSNHLLSQAVYKHLVPQKETSKISSLGNIMRLAKKDLGNDQNKLNFSLIGDPALKLHYPEKQVKTLKINQVEPAEATLNALGLIEVQAQVYDEDVPNTDFEGTAMITLYDKIEKITTLSGKGNLPFTYKDYNSILYNGSIHIENGMMNFTFMVPKDINYKLGDGRLVYYIYDTNSNQDGHGCEDSFQVGGSAPDVEPAVDGPDIRIYLNSPSFQTGQEVNSKPVFFAHLYDKNGINTVGAGIGHDITLKLNNNPNSVTILNKYYESNLNDYTSGTVRYPFQELKEGHYTLEFKAWNLQNISNTQTIDFVVKNGLKPSIDQFNIYPNPIHTESTFSIAYDRPEDEVQVEFSIYDLAGAKLWSAVGQYNSPTGEYQTIFNLNKAEKSWAAGIYLVKVTITTSEGTFNHKTQKIIVLPQ